MVVAIIGATPKEDRYAYSANVQLKAKGHDVVQINPQYETINDEACYKSLDEINKNVDVITLYIRPTLLKSHIESIINKKPKAIIFNPGTEDEDIIKSFEEANINVIQGCTLVMLRTGQFDKSIVQ